MTLTDGWSAPREFHIADVWVNPPGKPGITALSRSGLYTLLFAVAGAGVAIGSIITAILSH